MNRRRFLTSSAAVYGATTLTQNAVAAAAAPVSAPSLPESPPNVLNRLVNLDDVETAARAAMAPAVHEFVSGGSADELTVRWNREKYRDLRLNPRALVDVSGVDATITLFGRTMPHPILLAPTSNQRLSHPEGELATARAASLTGTTMVLSTGTNTAIEEVIAATTSPVWFQLYVAKDRQVSEALVRRVEAAGAQALCVTIDAPVEGPQYRNWRAGLVVPPGVTYPLYTKPPEPLSIATLDEVKPFKLDWKDITWLRTLTKLPLLLKGIINPLDAERGIEHGVDGIIVSNHGGRSLDMVPATIEALPRVVAQVRGRVPVIVDGGIRRGSDVVKALALGAAAVQIGRPYVYGLAVGGAAGVAHVVKILRKELLQTMALIGRPTIASIDRTALWE